MHINEYNQVAGMNYLEYCDYLQTKYGIGRTDYMSPTFVKNPKCSRTAEGLFAHHKMEDRMIMLSTKQFAELCPHEWQQKQNIVYCDYLEHLLLHILICEYPSPETPEGIQPGIGGVVNFIVPELNDIYSGWQTKQAWLQNCIDKVIDDKDVYVTLVRRFITGFAAETKFDTSVLRSSMNERYGTWSVTKNKKLFKEIGI